MATIGNSFLNLIDMISSEDEQMAKVIEMLHRLSPFVQDAIATPCNSGTSHMHSIRTGLPAVVWGRIYQGIPQSKSARAQVKDTTGFVEGLSTVDKRLLDISPNAAATRLAEAKSFLESLTQAAETAAFYANSNINPEQPMGLATRYSKLSGGQASSQVISAGGSGSDNTSAWFVTHAEDATTLIYPQGTKAGITREDKGEQRVTDTNGNAYYVMEELFRWHFGVAVRDWRTNARVCNIDVSDLQAGTVDIYKFLRKAYHKLHQVRFAQDMKDPNAASIGRTVLYVNSDLYEAMDAMQTSTTNTALRLTPMDLEGREVMTYRGIPIRKTDALLNTETVVS